MSRISIVESFVVRVLGRQRHRPSNRTVYVVVSRVSDGEIERIERFPSS